MFLSILAGPSPAEGISVSGWDVTPQATAGLSFDDNINRTDEGDSDFITNLAVGLGLERPTRRGKIKAVGSLAQELFVDHDEFNNLSEHLAVTWRDQFSKADHVRMDNRFVHAEEPQTFEDAFGNISGRHGYYRNQLNIEYTRDLAKQLSITTRYVNEIYDVTRSDLRDSVLHRAGLQTDYSISSATAVHGMYEVAHRELNPGSHASSHSLATGVRHSLTKQLYADGRVGVTLVDSFSNENDAKLLLEASLTDELDEDVRLRLSFAKNTATTFSTPDLFDSWRITGQVIQQLMKRLHGFASAFFGQGSYDTLNIEDDLIGANLGLVYELTKRTTGRLTYTLTSVDSTGPARDYTRNVIFLGVRAEF